VKLIVGLGNPGIEYQFTPHNIGFLAVDRLAERHNSRIANRQCKAATGRVRIGGHDVLLAKPETYMNLSGQSVAELVRKHEIDPADVVVVYDEMDLPMGSIRIRERGSSAGHNGMASIMGALDTQEICRVRIGMAPEHGRRGAKHVLSQFKKSQYQAIDEVLDRAAEALEMVIAEGVAAAMNRYNRKPGTEAEAAGPKKPRAKKASIVTFEDAKRKAEAAGKSVEVFRHGSLLVKIGMPRGRDLQQPHTRDEMYVVAQGGGEFVSGDKRQKVAAGDFLFAPAGVEHRFEDFTDDFFVWVMFYGPEGGEQPPKKGE
jgi:peptidyl-tRNA hydrolase, PTH1 family